MFPADFLKKSSAGADFFRERLRRRRFGRLFLATSVIFAGTGKLGAENGGEPCDFQISQRADFFRMLYGTHTNANRPLINQRDEPLANQSKYGRLHVIFDDTPMADATLFCLPVRRRWF